MNRTIVLSTVFREERGKLLKKDIVPLFHAATELARKKKQKEEHHKTTTAQERRRRQHPTDNSRENNKKKKDVSARYKSDN